MSSREKRTPANGPPSARSTASASATVRFATRNEWPDVAGSRDSIATIDARTNPSKSCWIAE